MSDTEIAKRIALPPQMLSRLSAEVQRIREKGDNFKVNEAKLAVAIIDLFFDKYIEKQRDCLAGIFFDKKLHLKNLIESSTNDAELSSSVSAYLKLSRPRQKKNAPETK